MDIGKDPKSCPDFHIDCLANGSPDLILNQIPADQIPRLSPSDTMKQNQYLEGLDKEKKQEVAALIDAWKEPFNLAKQIVSILDKFSSENGIMPPKAGNPFNYAIR